MSHQRAHNAEARNTRLSVGVTAYVGAPAAIADRSRHPASLKYLPDIPDKSRVASCQSSPLSDIPCHRRSAPAVRRGAAALRTATRADIRLVRGDGTEEAFALPTSALPAFADLLDRLSTRWGYRTRRRAVDTRRRGQHSRHFPPARAPANGCGRAAVPPRRHSSAHPAGRCLGASRTRGTSA